MLLIRRPWDSQPQEAVWVDWDNPVSRGLDVIARRLDSDVLTTTGRVVLSRAGAPTVAASTQGVAATFGNSSSNYFAATGLFPTTANGVGYTYLICYVLDAIGTLNIPIHCDQGDRVFQIQVSATGQPVFIPFNTSSSAFSVTGQAIAAGVPVVVVARATPTAASLWANGVKATDTAITGTLQGHTPASAVFQIGARATSGTPFNGKIALVARWNRPISDAEAAVISANPWQLFAPRSIWVPVSAGGGGTSIAGALGTAVASGFTGTVNANRTIAGTLGTAVASGFTGTVANSTDTTITGALGTATASGFQGTVNANRTIAGALGTAVASGFTGTVSNSNDTVISGALGTATAIGYQAFVNANRTIAGNLGTAVASGYTGTVQNGAAAEFSKNANLYLGIGSDLSILLGNPRMPNWNTAGRPAAPLNYVYGFNTDTNAIEVWTGSAWV